VYLILASGSIVIQKPSHYCSLNKFPDPTSQELMRLSEIGLDIPSSTDIDEKNTTTGMITPTDSDASSSMNYDLNLTMEENEENLRGK